MVWLSIGLRPVGCRDEVWLERGLPFAGGSTARLGVRLPGRPYQPKATGTEFLFVTAPVPAGSHHAGRAVERADRRAQPAQGHHTG